MDFDAALKEIFSSYGRVKSQIEGRLDSEVRNPQIILDLARELSLLPCKSKIIRVTGSKGKGTTSRMVASYLKALRPEENVGLIVSPEELDHNDRIRINNIPISKEEFLDAYLELRDTIELKKAQLSGNEYLSPSGLFLLIGLFVFQKRGCSLFVLETGRGVIHDEAGNVPSLISIVTTIFNEHPDYIGPTLENIAFNKLSIGLSSERVVLGSSAMRWNDKLQVIHPSKIVQVVPSGAPRQNTPKWYEVNDELARSAVQTFSPDLPIAESLPGDLLSGSFGTLSVDGIDIVYDAVIGLESIDEGFYRKVLGRGQRAHLIASWPDEKPVLDLITKMEEIGFSPLHVTLEPRGSSLSYEITKSTPGARVLQVGSDASDLRVRQLILEFCVAEPGDLMLFAGTQSFIRLVKRAFNGA